MDMLIILPIISSLVTGAFVAAVNHVFNRRYMLLVEREKYRQALFSEKLKAYRDIAEAIYKLRVAVVDILSDASRGVVGHKEFFERFEAAQQLALDVHLAIDRHIFLIPDTTVDRISLAYELSAKRENFKTMDEARAALEVLIEDVFSLLDILRDDLGINEFAEKLTK